MPIIEQVSPDKPLSQGDILQGIKLFKTSESWIAEEDKPVVVNKQLCLIVSRPCVCEHKPFVTAVSIEKYAESIPEKEVEDFEDLVAFLRDTRDAPDSPDVFYLGEIAGRKGRFAAKLDSVHCVEMPPDPTAKAAFVAERRIGRLLPDFVRDLHTRIFRAIANLGFDDFGWFSDADLQMIIDKGTAKVRVAEARIQELGANKLLKEFSGGEAASRPMEEAQSSLAKSKEAVAPYEAERERRQKK